MEFDSIDVDYIKKIKGHKYRSLIRSPDNIPQYGGIYVWRYWPDIKSLDKEGLIEFINRLNSNFPVYKESLKSSRVTIDLFRTPFGSPSDKKIFGIDLNNKKIETIFNLLDEKEGCIVLVDIINYLLSISPPIYVGKADNFNLRLKQHFELNTEFSRQLAKTDISKGDIYISFLKDNSGLNNKYFTLGIEEILQRVTNPPLTKRYG